MPAREPIDFAIVDPTMPDMGGPELIERIRAEHAQAAMPALSLHAEAAGAARAFPRRRDRQRGRRS